MRIHSRVCVPTIKGFLIIIVFLVYTKLFPILPLFNISHFINTMKYFVISYDLLKKLNYFLI